MICSVVPRLHMFLRKSRQTSSVAPLEVAGENEELVLLTVEVVLEVGSVDT